MEKKKLLKKWPMCDVGTVQYAFSYTAALFQDYYSCALHHRIYLNVTRVHGMHIMVRFLFFFFNILVYNLSFSVVCSTLVQ